MLDTGNTHKLLLVTGPSGAGRTTAMKVLQDIGYETIDNLPFAMLQNLLEDNPLDRPLALGVDVRNRDFSVGALIEIIDSISTNTALNTDVVYLDCHPDVLVRRFSETRRRHPLTPSGPPVQGVEREIDLLTPIRARADILIETSDLSPHQLRAEIERWFAPESDKSLAVTIHSFSYKRGLPRGVDMIFDCRFLKNPYWDESLREFDGRDAPVAAYIATDPRFAPFFEKVSDLVEMLLPAYTQEGKSHLSIGFGCTGGQHRSVALTEKLAKTLAKGDWQVSIRHREQERRGDV